MQGLRQARHDRNLDVFRRQLAAVIGATAEAARMGTIQQRIETVIRQGYDHTDPTNPAHLGNFGIGLQNAWARLSTLVHQSLEGHNPRPVTVDHRTYSNWRDVSRGTTAAPRIAPFISLYSAR